VLGQAIIENLETQEEVEGYELIDAHEKDTKDAHQVEVASTAFTSISRKENADSIVSNEAQSRISRVDLPSNSATYITQESQIQQPTLDVDSLQESDRINIQREELPRPQPMDTTITKKIKKPILKRTFALKQVGYKVIPYEDEFDSRYSFKNENVVFVNKANSTYKAEATRGEEFLLRHIISIVAEALAETKHPEGKDALELQNRLVAEAIRIHDRALTRK
jgi:hypothetical protein